MAAVADVFDALTSDRPYRQAFPIERGGARSCAAERGKHFDPRLVDLFFENVDELLELRDRHTPPLITPDMPAGRRLASASEPRIPAKRTPG